MRLKRYYIASFACLLAFAACTEEFSELIPSSSVKTTIVASFDDNKTKTTLDTSEGAHSTISWSADDAISVFTAKASDGGSKFTTADGGAEATFVGEIASGASKFFGVYPYREDVSFDGSKTFTTLLPSVQQAVENDFDPASFISVASTTSGDASALQMCFFNVCGGLRFTVDEPGITKVVFKGNNGEDLAGTLSINASNAKEPEAIIKSNASSSVELVADGSFIPGEFYYITFLPQVFGKGFTLDFYKGSSKYTTTTTGALATFKRSVFSTVRKADLQSMMDLIKGGINLSADGTSNCYIVSEPGQYMFPMVKGNSSTSVGTVSNVSVLWETNNTSTKVVTGSIISSVSIKGNYAYFSTPDVLKNGNALIAAYDASGKVLWSWHIWVCSGYDPKSTSQQYKGKTEVWMDRNIGALSADRGSDFCYGLLYQWGRKDPFVGFVSAASNAQMATTGTFSTAEYAEKVGTVAFTIANPTTFITSPNTPKDWHFGGRDNTLWVEDKTIYDPCPAGWRIPMGGPDGVWDDLEDAGYLKPDKVAYGAVITLAGSGSAWYPATGYINVSGQPTMNLQYGTYWSCKTNSQYASILEIYLVDGYQADVNGICGGKVRAEGRSVRCVAE